MKRFSIFLAATLGLSSTATAGSGPWVLGEGARNVYVGFEAQRLTRFAFIANGERDTIDVDGGIQTFGAKVIGTLGLTNRLDIELDVPYYYVQADTPGAVCESLTADTGRETCETTSSLGIITARAKLMLLDEIVGKPLTMSAGLEARFGHLTASTRDRITNVGEGTLDAGGFLSVGRTVTVGSGYLSSSAEVGGRYRVPKDRDSASADGSETVRAPGPEFWTVVESLYFIGSRVGIGPVATLFIRPSGLDFGDIDATSIDRFSVLNVGNVRVGGQFVIRGSDNVSASVNVQRVVWARNNPEDVWVVGIGVGAYIPRREDR